MACDCCKKYKVNLEDIKDPIVIEEIQEIRKHLKNAVCNRLSMVKISSSYMTDINYYEDRELRIALDNEIEARKLGDKELSDRIDKLEGDSEKIDQLSEKVTELSDDVSDMDTSIETLNSDIDFLKNWIEEHAQECSEAINAEKERAMSAESELNGKIEALDTKQSEAIETEKSRATEAEYDLHNQIVAETERAMEEESGLQQQIDDIASAEYDSETRTLIF